MSALFGSRMNYLRRVRVIPSRWFLLLIILTALAPRCLSQKPGHGGSTFRLSELVGFRQSQPFGSVAAETDNHFFPASIIF
jgi:hypothetical protein